MERNGNTIINSESEQATYNLAPMVSVEGALITASVFLEVADGLEAKAAQTDDRSNSEVALMNSSPNTRNKDLYRASELRRYSWGVMKLCPEEIIAKLVDFEFPPIEES
ncbi:MAG: hypothetical protein ABI602_02055 [Candidatus Saccharibacteria bacterium]